MSGGCAACASWALRRSQVLLLGLAIASSGARGSRVFSPAWHAQANDASSAAPTVATVLAEVMLRDAGEGRTVQADVSAATILEVTRDFLRHNKWKVVGGVVAAIGLCIVLYHWCRPAPPFPQPFKLTFTAGVLMLIVVQALFAVPSLIITWAFYHFGKFRWTSSVIIAGVSMLIVYTLFFVNAWLRWRRFFSALHSRSDVKNITSGRCPREQEVGPGECKVSMRPTRIEFAGYIWGMCFIYPFYLVYTIYSVGMALVRTQLLYRMGCIRKGSCEEALAQFLLETTTSLTWFQELVVIKDPRGQDSTCAVFSSKYFDPVSFPQVGGGLCERRELEVKVDLTANPKFAFDAKCDGKPVTVEEIMFLIVYLVSWQGHTWLHSIAMWGSDQFCSDPWVAKMSFYSVFFSHLGGDDGIAMWNDISGAGLDKLRLPDLVPFQRPLRDFERWRPLRPYSRFINFIEGSREVFFRALSEPEFAKAFPPLMDPEGHYATTILHSLDHWNLYQCFCRPDRFVLFVNNFPKRAPGDIDFTKVSMLQYVFLAVADDWPKLFSVYFRDSPHPFYKRVYEECVALDAELAWHMQCCMIK